MNTKEENQLLNVGDIIELTGKTRRGKVKILQHGKTWKVIDIRDSVPCIQGRGFLIESVFDSDVRWVCQDNDCDFFIVAPERCKSE